MRFADICNEGVTIPIGVTLLTDINESDCSLATGRRPDELVVDRAKQYLACGFKGVTCSGRELKALGDAGLLPRLETVVPGTRLFGNHSNFHQRVTTPREAVRDGATWLVAGSPFFGDSTRSITDPNVSNQAVLEFLEDMDKA
jgi:orotidine-5'-phosphate decarboxylase